MAARTSRRTLIVGLSAWLAAGLGGPAPAAAGSRSSNYRRSGGSYRSGSRSRSQRDHHRGRSFGERRSRLRNPSYLRRDERRRALSDDSRSPSPLRSGPSSSAPSQESCRTMTSVEEIEGRRALVSQRECFDAAGLSRVSPGSRRVIKYYEE